MHEPRDFPQYWYDRVSLEDIQAYFANHGWTAGPPIRVNPHVDCTSREWTAPDDGESVSLPDRSGAFRDEIITKWWAVRGIALTEGRSRAEVLLDIAGLDAVEKHP